MKLQRQELSALFDGELEAQEVDVRRIVKLAVSSDELREAWRDYALIGDQLRHESLMATDLTAGIMAQICQEPVVLAPGRVRRAQAQAQAQQGLGQHSFWALAASVAGVAVVGWLALSGTPQFAASDHSIAAATVAPAPTFIAASAGVAAVPASGAGTMTVRADLREYLLAHQIQASTFRLGDSTEHVRTVAVATTSSLPRP